MNLTDRIENETAEFMREEIKKCGGNEVFFRGILNENKKVLEEVIYSISYSVMDNYNVDKVNFFVNSEKVTK